MIRRIASPATSILSYRDNLGRVHFRPTPDTSRLAASFRAFQAKILAHDITSDDPLTRLTLALIAFEGIVTPVDLTRALVAVSNAYHYNGHVVIEWQREDKRQDRRFLSSLSASCIDATAYAPLNSDAADAAINAAANLVFPRSRSAVDELFRAAVAWAYESLPGVLFGHVTSLAPFCALPKSALVRHATGLALAVNSDLDSVSSEVVGEAMDRFFQQSSVQGSAWAIADLENACTHNRNLPRHQNKRDMLAQCQLISKKVGETDSLFALLLAWAADLIESGTRMEPDVHPGTIHNYVRRIAMPLHVKVRGEDILYWSAENFEECYKAIVSGAPAGKQGNTASALSSWHAFLVRWLDAPQLRIKLHGDVAEPLPAANMIWPNEKQRITEWLQQSNQDERLIEQLRVSIEIAWGGRIRAKELFRLRLHNIRLYSDLVEIEIAPMIRDGKLKTESALRVLAFSTPDAQSAIREWHARRQTEGALLSDFLFGDPHRPEKLYRLGSLYLMLNKLSKAATGDSGVCLHTWGHTWISTQVEAALLSPAAVDIEPLDEIATAAAHLSSATTIRHYSHLFERALRHHIDCCLRSLKLSSRLASAWSGVSAVALRQRTFSQQVQCQHVYWEAILQTPCPPSIQPVEDGVSTCDPKSPLSISRRETDTFESVLLAIADVAAGMDMETTALRSRRNGEWAGQLLRDIASVLSRVVSIPKSRYGGAAALWETTAAELQSPRHALDFSRINQPKFSTLRTAIGRLGREDAKVFVAAWEHCYAGSFISLGDARAAGQLLDGMAAAAIPSDHLALSIAITEENAPDGEALAAEAGLQYAFRKAYKGDAMVEYKKARRGRPARYLMWSSGTLKEDAAPASAALSVTGFNAMMFALAAFLERDDKEATTHE